MLYAPQSSGALAYERLAKEIIGEAGLSTLPPQPTGVE
jgi:hypothetical protein